MQLDQPQIQLIANVVGITTVTSLVSMWAILKRDKDKLAIAAKLRAREAAASPLRRPSAAPANPLPAAPHGPAPAVRQDIRQFVAQRAQVWAAPSPANSLTQG